MEGQVSSLLKFAEIIREHRKHLGENPGFETKTGGQRDVVRRTPLWSGAIISLLLPTDAEFKEIELDESRIAYLRFPLKTTGGIINCYLRSKSARRDVQIAELMRHMGKRSNVHAQVEVLEKEMQDGRVYTYLDLYLTHEPVSHELRVLEKPAQKAGVVSLQAAQSQSVILCFFPANEEAQYCAI